MKKIRATKIIIKPFKKGFIVVVMTPEFYRTMCQSHLNNEQYYQNYASLTTFLHWL